MIFDHDGRPPERGPETKNEWGILVIISFFFGLFLLAELAIDFTVAKLSVPFFLLSWVVLLAIHEFGHAIMARLLGWRVDLVAIGSGKVRSRFSVLGMPVELRTIPLSGFAVPRPTDLILPRLKQFLIYAAGPGIELFLAFAIALLIGFGEFFTRTTDVGLIAIQSFCAAAVVGATINLIPFPHRTENGNAWSDGLGMILCWKLPDEAFGDPEPSRDTDASMRRFF